MGSWMELDVRLTPADSGTTRVYPFRVPPRARRLAIRMTYSPMRLGDPDLSKALIQAAMRADAPWEPLESWERFSPLSNLVTLSLDDPEKYRGNAHRKDGDQVHVLSEAEASPGFLPGAILPGVWRASIHIHALVTRECVLRLAADEVET